MRKIMRISILVIMGLSMLVTLNACGQTTQATPTKNTNTTNKKAATAVQPSLTAWQHASEKKPYPDMKLNLHRYLYVSIAHQRVYVKDTNHKTLYTMLCSTGNHNGTPRGTFHIQLERGSHFYNASSKEGANYWTSWKDHGIYLFHSVPVNEHGDYLMKDAHELGKTANSHGCIRLSVPDAKWINEKVPTGTKVVIK
jgi:lipoprotein-anchoring transpeptidase ErfK/SrfK